MSSYEPPYTITTKMLALSTEIGEALTKLEYEENRIITPQLRKINRIKTIAGTLEIEGNFIGEEKITALLEGKRVLGTYEEILEVEGAIEAYRAFESYGFDSLDDLLRAHKLLMKGILKNAGSFRSINVGVGNHEGVSHVAPPHGVVPDLMKQLFTWLQKSDEHLLIKSCVFHYEFEFIHPFSDGNGRIGRLWQSVILYHWRKVFNAIPTESMIRNHQERYYQALEEAGELGESTPFIEFMLEVILETIQKVGNRVGNRVGNELSANQQQIILALRDNPKLSAQKLSEIIGISKRKIEENLAKLKGKGMVQRIGGTRGYWEVSDEV
ncbi:MAG TPA: Fic family protein [Epsilonproteobacteria bacterium]|nr:Fic family protein [Campylobacterota bacterium]